MSTITPPLTREAIAALRWKLRVATEGEWEVYAYTTLLGDDRGNDIRSSDDPLGRVCHRLIPTDAALIAALRNAAPALLDAADEALRLHEEARTRFCEDGIRDLADEVTRIQAQALIAERDALREQAAKSAARLDALVRDNEALSDQRRQMRAVAEERLQQLSEVGAQNVVLRAKVEALEAACQRKDKMIDDFCDGVNDEMGSDVTSKDREEVGKR